MSTDNGALIQLVAFGIQDVYLVTDPEITFYKSVYRRHTNFSIEQMVQKFDNVSDFGKKSTSTIGRLGDLISNCTLEITVPTIFPSNPLAGTEASITDLVTVVSNGVINNITINDDGEGYSTTTIPTINVINANGVNADITVSLNTGVIDSVIINDGGSNYKLTNVVISVSGGSPTTPAILDITSITNGVIDGISIIDGGTGYVSIPTIDISNLSVGVGVGASVVPVISTIDGSIDSLTVIDGGEGYVADSTLILIDDNGLPPTFEASLDVVVGDITNIRTGMIDSLIVSDNGSGYSYPPTISIQNANGQFATITVSIDGLGSINSVSIINGGTNYKLENTSIVLGGSATFTTVGVLSVSSVENGVITGVNIDDAGLGYSETPTVLVTNIETGIGTGATGEVIIDTTTGQIIGANVLNAGENYKLNTTIIYLSGGSPSNVGEIIVGSIDDTRNGMINEISLNQTTLGSGYLLPPKVVIEDSGVGSGAIVEAVISNGELSGFDIINGGKNYNPLTTSVTLNGGIPVNVFAWVDNLAHVITKSVEIQIGGQLIDKHYTEWFNILKELTTPFGKKNGYDKMIGNVSDMTDIVISNSVNNSIQERVLYLPLKFWFNKDVNYALPLIALYYHEVKIAVQMRNVKDCVKDYTGYLAKIDTTYLSRDIKIGDRIVLGDVVAYIQVFDVGVAECFLYFEYENRTIDDEFKFKKDDFIFLNLPFGITVESSSNMIKLLEDPVLVENTLYSLPKIKNCELIVDYIYLDADEKYKFASRSHEYIIEQLQFTGSEDIIRGENVINLNYNHPCKALYWVILMHENLVRNNLSNYTNEITKFDKSKGVNPIVKGVLTLNNKERFPMNNSDYFNLIQPYYSYKNIPSEGYNIYNFSLDLTKVQACGSCNMSQFEQVDLRLFFNEIDNQYPSKIFPFGLTYNVFKILSGMGGVKFVN